MAEYKSIYTGQQIDTAIGKANTALQEELEPAFNGSASKDITAQDITNWNNKSDFSGSYNDLSNKPTIPTNSDFTLSGLSEKSYNNLTDKPTIPDVSNFITKDVEDLTYYTKSSNLATVATSGKSSDLNNDSGFIDKDVNNLTNYYKTSETYTKTEVDSKLSSVYKYKGTVSTYGDLPSSDLTIGDVYNIETADSTHGIKAGDNVAWKGSTWDVLAGTVDLSGYQTLIDSSHKLSSDLVDDTNNTNKFVTASEKTAWGNKYDKPIAGIPKTDLASDVQTSLGKADTAIQDISGKQDTLVSGTNIKTINSTSLLGSGNIDTETIQYSTMPTADSTTVGKIVQYIGTTDSTYTNGYFYVCVSDGGQEPTYSWEQINIQPMPVFDNLKVGKFVFNNETKVDLSTLEPGVYINGLNANYTGTAFTYNGKNVTSQIGLYFLVTKKITEITTKEIFIYYIGYAYNSNILDYEGKLQYFTISYNPRAASYENPFSTNMLGGLGYIIDDKNQIFSGIKTFSSIPKVSSYTAPTIDTQLTAKKYVDDQDKALLVNIAPTYDSTATYDLGDYVMYNNVLYKCSTAISVAEAWDSTHWTQTTVMAELGNITTVLATLATPSVNNGGNE